jgi:3-phosphoshikimate 1-carboxyvinyltransferase
MEARFIAPARRIRGEVRVPGDKSIAHRAALVGSVSEGTTAASNFPAGADCRSTLRCLAQLGVRIEQENDRVRIEGRGLGGLLPPERDLDAGNSGTTVRLLAGILAGHPFGATIVGDASLSRRPMARIVEPLSLFGARVEASEGRLPLRIEGGRLNAIDYRLPVASAQVKSAVLLAGAHAAGTTAVEEPSPTRDHTEIALLGAGARLRRSGSRIQIEGGAPLHARTLDIPGDVSSAAFMMAAALALPDSELKMTGLGLNPTRTGFPQLVQRLGGRISWENCRESGGEPVGDAVIVSSSLGHIEVDGPLVPALVDELPVLAVLGALSGRGVRIRGAGELRHKETDRIRALVTNLALIGADVEELDDGLRIQPSRIDGGSVSSFGDHRIAMAFAIAGLASRRGVTVEDPRSVDVSFPGFFELLESLVER